MEAELLDWELVHGSDTESTDSMKKPGSGSSVMDDGMILSDHFSAGNLVTLPDQSLDYSRVVNGSESFDQSGDGFVRNELGFYDSKVGTFGDGEVKVSDFEAADEKVLLVDSEGVTESTGGSVSHCEDGNLLESDHLEVGDGSGHVEEREAVSESTDGTVTDYEGGHLLKSDDVEVGDGRRQSGVGEPNEDLSYLRSDSGGNELVSGDSGIVNGEGDVVGESEPVEESGGSTLDVVAVDSVVRSGDESKSRETVWWKMPFVIVKYYAFRIGPVWSVSMAAALMGFVLLGRRLYNMKKKAQRFHLKVAIDDKKVSRVMSQAARLNEAFTEVRRVPVIRPALPSPGAWPVLSLR